MRGIFCTTTARTNEEYKKVIKRRMNYMLLLGLAGAATLVIALLSEFYWKVSIKEEMLGVYAGAGSGLLFAAVVLWIRNKCLLGNEEKLKESRLANADERIHEINNKAIRSASFVMVAVMYVAALIGGLYYPVLVKILFFLVSIFLFAYIVFYQIYNKRM